MMRRGGSGSFITFNWQLVKSKNFRLRIEIFMLYDVKRKFYNCQLVDGLFGEGQVYLLVHGIIMVNGTWYCHDGRSRATYVG